MLIEVHVCSRFDDQHNSCVSDGQFQQSYAHASRLQRLENDVGIIIIDTIYASSIKRAGLLHGLLC